MKNPWESPSRIFRVKTAIIFQAHPLAVPVDEEGIIPSELEKVLQAHQDYRPREPTERKPYWAMLYLIPVYHNPTGVCLSPGVLCACVCFIREEFAMHGESYLE